MGGYRFLHRDWHADRGCHPVAQGAALFGTTTSLWIGGEEFNSSYTELGTPDAVRKLTDKLPQKCKNRGLGSNVNRAILDYLENRFNEESLTLEDLYGPLYQFR